MCVRESVAYLVVLYFRMNTSEIFRSPYFCYALVPLGLYSVYKLLNVCIPGPQRKGKLEFKDRTVLITGASTGLGKAIALELYKKGAKLILTARSVDKLKELCDELEKSGVKNPHKPVYRFLDICDPKDVEGLVKMSIDGKHIDVLINNAGLSNRGPISDTSMDVHRQIMEVNYFGHLNVTKTLLPYLDTEGAIISTSSVQGRVSIPFRSAYAASKHALQAFFDALRCEVFPLHVMVVSLGYVNTGFGAKALDVSGKPVCKEDENQLKGYTPEYAAKEIVRRAERRETDVVLAPLVHRIALYLRLITPNLFFYFLYKRGLKDEYGTRKQ